MTIETVQDQALLRAAEAIDNPYWDTLVREIPGDPIGRYGREHRYSPVAYGRLWDRDRMTFGEVTFPRREELVRRFSWAIPNPQTIAWIVERLEGRSVVEIGAGRGYWAWMLSQMGVKVTAFDQAPPDQAENWFVHEHEDVERTYTQEDVDAWHKRWDPLLESSTTLHELTKDDDTTVTFPDLSSMHPKPPVVGERFTGQQVVPGSRVDTFHEVIQGGPEVLKDFAHSALFLCWPTYDDSFATESVRTYAGDLVVYCGEGEGGCTGDDELFRELATNWEEEGDNWPFHTQWEGINDYVQIYRRRA